MWRITGMSLLAGMSTAMGGYVVLQFKQVSPRLLATFLGMAAGIMVTVIITELIPTSIRSGGNRLFILGALAGWILMWLMNVLISAVFAAKASHQATDKFLKMGWFIAVAIAIHDLPEGLAIGAGDAVRHQVGLLLTLAIALHNIPEGMSIAAPLTMAGVSKRRILAVTVLTGLVTPLGTLASFWLIAASNLFIGLSLAFASGAMAFVVAHDLFPEAYQLSKAYAFMGVLIGSTLMTSLAQLH